MSDIQSFSGNWNMAQAYMQRLDACMQAINMAKVIGNLMSFYSSCDNLYAEIHPKLKENHELLKSIDKVKEEVDEAYNAWIEVKDLKKSKHIGKQYATELLNLLNKFNLKLRDAAHECKLLLPESLDPRGAIFDQL